MGILEIIGMILFFILAAGLLITIIPKLGSTIMSLFSIIIFIIMIIFVMTFLGGFLILGIPVFLIIGLIFFIKDSLNRI